MTDTATSQPAGLEALGSMTAEVDGANPSAEQQQQAQQEATQAADAEEAAAEWGMLMFTVGGFASMIAPELQQIYTEQRCYRWGQAAHAVANKYKLESPKKMPELLLISSTLTFLVPTFFILRDKLREMKEGKAPESWLSKFGVWWRTRKARRDVAAMADPQQADKPGARDGGQQ